MQCARLRAPANGRVKQGRKLFGTVANYTCRGGYGLMGVSARTCQADGTWSGSAPYCHSKHACACALYVAVTGRKRTLFHCKWANSISYNYL